MSIGTRIKEKRLELGLTQEELAKRLGYKSKSTINKIEMDINDIPQSKVVAFAEALNTTIAYLMDWDDEPHVHEERTQYYLNEEAGELAKEMFERPELKVLFDASRNVTKEDILSVANILEKLKTYEDGDM